MAGRFDKYRNHSLNLPDWGPFSSVTEGASLVTKSRRGWRMDFPLSVGISSPRRGRSAILAVLEPDSIYRQEGLYHGLLKTDSSGYVAIPFRATFEEMRLKLTLISDSRRERKS